MAMRKTKAKTTRKGWYVRIRRNPSWEQAGEIGPFVSETIARKQARNMPSPAPGFVINVEGDSPKVRAAQKIGNMRKAGAVVSNPALRQPAVRRVTGNPGWAGRVQYLTRGTLTHEPEPLWIEKTGYYRWEPYRDAWSVIGPYRSEAAAKKAAKHR
jgi:hypothetical protein